MGNKMEFGAKLDELKPNARFRRSRNRWFKLHGNQGVVMLDETLTGTFLPKDQGHTAAVLARAPPHLLATYGHLRPLTATYGVVPAPNSAVSCPDYTTILSALPLARRLSVDGAFTSGVSFPIANCMRGFQKVKVGCRHFNACQSSRPPCMTNRGTALCPKFKRNLPHQPNLKVIDERSLSFSSQMLVLPKPLLGLELFAGSR